VNAISTHRLSHRFGESLALDELDLAVPRGSIYGFLGPNGAGKTTTLRLILGLLRRQSGSIEVFGRDLERDRVAVLRCVGSSIETPSLYAALTARENLEVWRRVFDAPRSRVEEALRLVDLAGTGRKRAGQFSLGMKQRLSLAVALLHEPELLLLDEPTNGLDPHGILEMRDLLLRLNRERGATIVVSSHLLSEVERVVDHVGVIDRGELRFQGPLADLVARGARSAVTIVGAENAQAAAAALAEIRGSAAEARVDGDEVVLPALADGEAAQINAALVARGFRVHRLETRRLTLEQVFLELVAGAPQGPARSTKGVS
jgi:lantibiotic transport system ATP-binding protein